MSTASRAKRPVLAVIVIIIVVLAGVGVYFATQTSPSAPVSSSTGVTSASLPNTLVVDSPYVPDSFDPAVATSNQGEEVAQVVDLPLNMCADASCSSFLPVLATSWTASSDGLTYTYVLRNGVYFSNGDQFNAYVVWWNVYRDMIINQALDYPFYLYFNTTGVTAADVNSLNNPQNTPDSNLLQVMENPHNSVTVLNASTVQFHLTNPFVAFMKTAVGEPWVLVDPYLVEQHGGVVVNQPNTWMATNGTVVGDGPYVMQRYVLDQYTIMVANPNYWAQNLTSSETNFMLQPAKIPKVIIYYRTDELTRALDLEGNMAQAAAISFDDIAKVKAACSNCYIPNAGPTATLEFLVIQTLKPPLDNVLVRRAIIAAINLTQIQQTVYNGYAASFVGPQPSVLQYYDNSIQPPAYDVSLAKQLLAEAGYPNGEGLRPLEYYFPTSSYESLVSQIVKSDLAEIGVTVNLHQASLSAFYAMCAIPGQNATSMDIYQAGWTWWPDFSGYEFIVDQRFGSYLNMRNDTIYNLVLKSNSELDPTARAQEISQITRDVQQQAAYIWLGDDVNLYSEGTSIGPFVFNKCVAGTYYNVGLEGEIPYNMLYYTCSP